ncbi:MAG TPA: hypothetical protein PKC18_19560, partial [Lacipirellulaceae bacterium]|nr:hypothetical protein [Lacipirellulaceae bacterium]
APAHAEPTPPTAASPPVAAAAAPADVAELEQNVLAGIEEFRSQLAQLKSQPAEDAAPGAPSPTPAAAL